MYGLFVIIPFQIHFNDFFHFVFIIEISKVAVEAANILNEFHFNYTFSFDKLY